MNHKTSSSNEVDVDRFRPAEGTPDRPLYADLAARPTHCAARNDGVQAAEYPPSSATSAQCIQCFQCDQCSQCSQCSQCMAPDSDAIAGDTDRLRSTDHLSFKKIEGFEKIKPF